MTVGNAAADILVIGCGNELRRDDGLGPLLARAMAERDWPGVHTLSVHQLTPELAATIAEHQVVIFIDAAVSGEEVAITSLEPTTAGQAFTHHTDPARLLMLAQTSFGRCPQAWHVAVRGEEFGHGEGVSIAVAQRLGHAVKQIGVLVHNSISARTT